MNVQSCQEVVDGSMGIVQCSNGRCSTKILPQNIDHETHPNAKRPYVWKLTEEHESKYTIYQRNRRSFVDKVANPQQPGLLFVAVTLLPCKY